MVPPQVDIQSSLKVWNLPKATKTIFGELVEIRKLCLQVIGLV
jgi:hypothetical protein